MKEIITLVTEKNSGILKGERPDYLVYYIEGRASIVAFPLIMKDKIKNSPMCDVAYDYDLLSDKNKEKCINMKRTFEIDEDGFYIEHVKEYTCKRKVKSNKNITLK